MKGKIKSVQKVSASGHWESVHLYFLKDSGISDWREVTQQEFDRWLEEEQAKLPQVSQGDNSPLCSFPPLHSDGMGVHPERIPEAIESAKKKGVPTDFDKKGCPVFTSRSHRAAYLKAYHVHDRDGGYGDG